MSGKNIHFRSIAVWIFSCLITPSMHAQTADPFRIHQRIPEKMQLLPFGSIRPEGWLKAQLQQDLNGFLGHLDSLAPDLILKDDIYGKDRLTRKVKSKELGALGEGGDWQVQFLWWNSETQGNWWDGYIRSAILIQDPYHLKRVKTHIDRILATQDADGYLGIYDKELRYKFDNENGELWSKATLLRGLLAWYEYSRDPAVLKAVERAVKNVMDNYPINRSHPFYSIKPNVGGLSHGLAFTDVLESLYRINGNKSLLEYALFCYKDFSNQTLNEDAQYGKLLQKDLPLKGHGVHTYEHLRSLAAACYASGSPELAKAMDNFLYKISQTTTATGGPVGDEWIGGGKADATNRGYEYCSLHELMHSYTELYLKSGQNSFADKAERLFLNAAQGARHPEKSCIAYLKTDNSYFMTGGLNGDTSVKTQTRYKYSPVHQDAAVCCVPNAGRITPYYIQNMWLKEKDALVATLFGPNELKTTINGKPVSIREETSFPNNQTIRFIVNGADANFTLKIRKPAWAKAVTVDQPAVQTDDFIIIRKKWKGQQVITIEFKSELETEKDLNGEYFFTYGPLVLAHPLAGISKQTKTFPLPGYADLAYQPENLVIYRYQPGQPVQSTTQPGQFTVTLVNSKTGQPEPVTLEPVGKTILRQVTFKDQEK
ncbi:MAG: hypothetical protein E6Q24_11915 [Chitinophagaceae bacterium]|nr:MAG: hypothetical protein E6Q24_11915 [Chitinophagaceae bacterium]